MRWTWLLTIPFLLMLWLSCGKSTHSDREEILEYLRNNKLKAQDTLGVFVIVTENNSEEYPTENSVVTISYTGTYLDGGIFDRTPAGETVALPLRRAIEGLKRGLTTISKNSKGVIYIPSDLGYGSNPPYGIRKNAVLVYSVSVHDFE